MTGLERDAFETAYLESKANRKPNIRGSMVAFSACDQDGQRIFTDADAEALGNMPSAELDKVFAAAQKLNAIDEDDIKELEGNSDAALGDGSSSN